MSTHCFRLVAAATNIHDSLDVQQLFMEPTELSNPFVLLTAPETVFARLEYSDRLARLRRTVCRPLDKPVLGKPVELRAFDEAIDIAEASYDPLSETKPSRNFDDESA